MYRIIIPKKNINISKNDGNILLNAKNIIITTRLNKRFIRAIKVDPITARYLLKLTFNIMSFFCKSELRPLIVIS
jgi:hypothetical protein